MKKRNKKDIWFGLYDFPLVEATQPNVDFSMYDMTRILAENYRYFKVRSVKQVLSHQLIFATFYRWHLDSPRNDILTCLPGNGRFYKLEEIERIPKPVLIDKYLKEE